MSNFGCRGTDETSRSKRMHIYVSLLKQMAPEHLLATSAKLCAEILAGVCDGLLSIDDATGRAVLQVHKLHGNG
jgi:condensin-2 complex subunit D3